MKKTSFLNTNQTLPHVRQRATESAEDTMRYDFNSAYLYFNRYPSVNWNLILDYTRGIAAIPTQFLLFTDINTQFMLAFQLRNKEHMRLLLIKDNKLISRMDRNGYNLFMRLVLNRDVDGVMCLSNFDIAYFNLSARVGDPDGWKVNQPDSLWLAIKYSSTAMLDALLRLKVPLQTYGEDAKLPTHVIVETDSHQNMRLFLAYHPELLKSTDASGRSPFTYALELGNFEFAAFLISLYPVDERLHLINILNEFQYKSENFRPNF